MPFLYLSALHETCLKSHIGLVVLFNGALEPNRMSEWTWRQIRDRERIQKTFRHIVTKGILLVLTVVKQINSS